LTLVDGVEGLCRGLLNLEICANKLETADSWKINKIKSIHLPAALCCGGDVIHIRGKEWRMLETAPHSKFLGILVTRLNDVEETFQLDENG
jgi:hypothetical protein